jgi:hypothetical protein
MTINDEKRKIWLIGKRGKRKGTYVVSLPVGWAEEVGGEGTEIKVSDYRGNLLLSPSAVKREPKRWTLAIKSTLEQPTSLLKYQIISAYLNNFREIRVKFEEQREDVEKMLKELEMKLSGLSTSHVSENERLISMSTMIKPVPEILQQMLSEAHIIHDINQESFLNLQLARDKSERVREVEDDIDKNSFLVKRLFCVATEQPEIIERVGIGELSKLVHWETLNSNLERVGDLQHEIHEELKLLGEGSKRVTLSTPDYGFKTYHSKAQEMVDDAYSEDMNKITTILDTKKYAEERPKHRGKHYIPIDKARSIESLVTGNSELRCLDVRVWGLTGCATNIAEAWLNMRGP